MSHSCKIVKATAFRKYKAGFVILKTKEAVMG